MPALHLRGIDKTMLVVITSKGNIHSLPVECFIGINTTRTSPELKAAMIDLYKHLMQITDSKLTLIQLEDTIREHERATDTFRGQVLAASGLLTSTDFKERVFNKLKAKSQSFSHSS